ncbi:hypothetical protein HK098_007729 [Nowakowskiella sp. JEL0407]|nr:hypothetical protein HK098_007729 [Nowakowskiella sp. JEL0407]
MLKIPACRHSNSLFNAVLPHHRFLIAIYFSSNLSPFTIKLKRSVCSRKLSTNRLRRYILSKRFNSTTKDSSPSENERKSNSVSVDPAYNTFWPQKSVQISDSKHSTSISVDQSQLQPPADQNSVSSIRQILRKRKFPDKFPNPDPGSPDFTSLLNTPASRPDLIKKLQNALSSPKTALLGWQYYETLAQQSKTIHRNTDFLHHLTSQHIYLLLQTLKIVNDRTRNMEIPQATRFLADAEVENIRILPEYIHEILEIYLWRCHRSVPSTLEFLKRIVKMRLSLGDGKTFPDVKSMMIVLKAAAIRAYPGDVDLVYAAMVQYGVKFDERLMNQVSKEFREAKNSLELLRLVTKRDSASSTGEENEIYIPKLKFPINLSESISFALNYKFCEDLAVIGCKSGHVNQVVDIISAWVKGDENFFISPKTYNSIINGFMTKNQSRTGIDWFLNWVGGEPMVPVKSLVQNSKEEVDVENPVEDAFENYVDSPTSAQTETPDTISYTIALQAFLKSKLQKKGGSKAPASNIYSEVGSLLRGMTTKMDDQLCAVIIGFFVEYKSIEFTEYVFQKWKQQQTEPDKFRPIQNWHQRMRTQGLIYGSVMKGYLVASEYTKALDMFQEMFANQSTRDFLIERSFVTKLLEACASSDDMYLPVQLAESFHFSRVTTGIFLNPVHPYNSFNQNQPPTSIRSILEQYYMLIPIEDHSRVGSPESRPKLIPQPMDAYMYSILIKVFTNFNKAETAMKAYTQMIKSGVKPTIEIVDQMVYLHRRQPHIATRIFQDAVDRYGISPDANLFCNLLKRVSIVEHHVLDLYGNITDRVEKSTITVSGQKEEEWNAVEEELWVKDIFRRMSDHAIQMNQSMYNFFLHKYASSGVLEVCDLLVHKMQDAGIEFNLKTFNLRMKAVAVAMIHERQSYRRFEPDRAEKKNLLRKFLDLFTEMRKRGYEPDPFTFEFIGLFVAVYAGKGGGGSRVEYSDRKFWMMIKVMQKKKMKPTRKFQVLFAKMCLRGKAELMQKWMWEFIGFDNIPEIMGNVDGDDEKIPVVSKEDRKVELVMRTIGVEYDLEPLEEDRDLIGEYLRKVLDE